MSTRKSLPLESCHCSNAFSVCLCMCVSEEIFKPNYFGEGVHIERLAQGHSLSKLCCRLNEFSGKLGIYFLKRGALGTLGICLLSEICFQKNIQGPFIVK